MPDFKLCHSPLWLYFIFVIKINVLQFPWLLKATNQVIFIAKELFLH